MRDDGFRIRPADRLPAPSSRRRPSVRIVPALPFAILILLSSGLRTSHASPAPPEVTPSEGTPTACALELSGFDAHGRIRVQTIAYALDRPGQLLVNLSRVRGGATPVDRLSVAPDPDLRGAVPGQSPYEVTGILRVDTSRDLAWLSAPGFPACDTSLPGREPLGPGDGAEGVPITRVDQPLIGIRDRDGYRPRLFRATLERTISIPGEVDLLMIRIPDGGGGRTGFLFDDRHRLFGTILPSAPHSDPALACAVAMTDGSPGISPPDRATLPVQALAASADLFHSTPTGLLAHALLLTRHDQADRAIGLLDEVAGAIGEFEDLLIERGVRQFTAGRTARAIEDFTRATRLNPGRYLAHYNLGIALGTSGRYLQAADALERALLIDPDHPRALFHLALAHQAAQRPERALRDYELLMAQDAGLADELRQILGY